MRVSEAFVCTRQLKQALRAGVNFSREILEVSASIHLCLLFKSALGLMESFGDELLGPEPACAAHPMSTSEPELDEGRQMAGGDLIAADIAVIADFSSGEMAWRLESEIRAQAELGYRTALIHVQAGAREAPSHIHPDINACVEQGLAAPVEPAGTAVRTRLALVYDAEGLFRNLLAGQVVTLPRILTDFVVAIGFELNRPPDNATAKQTDILIRSAFGTTTVWAAESQNVQRRMRENGLHVLDELWRPSVPASLVRPTGSSVLRSAPVIGCAGNGASAWWKSNAAEMTAAFGKPGQRLVRLLLPTPTDGAPFPKDWGTLYSDEVSLRNYLGGLDAFVFCPSDEAVEPPRVVIAAALSCGLPTILHPRYKSIFGDDALYADATKASALVLQQFQIESLARRQQCDLRATKALKSYGSHIHGTRVGALIGPASSQPPRKRISPRRKVLFVSTDVIGLGHLTRQLAIARRCPSHIDPIFATSSQGFNVVRQAGFEVEYIPYYDQARFDVVTWNDWLAAQLIQIMDTNAVDGIVFDGAIPHDGIVEAMKKRRRLASIWVRRGMWRKHQTRHALDRQRYFDLVIEPGDVASASDEGATRDFRCGVMAVPPITLLDRREILDRTAAAASLGLDPKRPAVLIQLGADITRDVAAVVDRILTVLAAHPDVQPVFAEWNISAVPLDLWPTLRRLRGFPFSRCYGAFDFSISAAGYNTFNEIISFQLPTIFLSNTNRVTDDQPGRAAFAQENGAALVLSEHDISGLRVGVESLLQEKARAYLRANCQKLAQPNGAAAAADAIAVMVE